MNHPKPEEWIPYLFGEAKGQVQRELKAHLDSCRQCQAEIAGWEQSLSRLGGWKLPRTRRQGLLALPILKWGVAAAVLLILGGIVGHFTASKPDIQAVRAALEPQMRQELTQIIREEVNKAAAITLARTEEQTAKTVAACASALESKRAQDYRDVHSAMVVLKEQLDTVAMNTDAGFRQAEQKLVQLAEYEQPPNPSTKP